MAVILPLTPTSKWSPKNPTQIRVNIIIVKIIIYYSLKGDVQWQKSITTCRCKNWQIYEVCSIHLEGTCKRPQVFPPNSYFTSNNEIAFAKNKLIWFSNTRIFSSSSEIFVKRSIFSHLKFQRSQVLDVTLGYQRVWGLGSRVSPNNRVSGLGSLVWPSGRLSGRGSRFSTKVPCFWSYFI